MTRRYCSGALSIACRAAIKRQYYWLVTKLYRLNAKMRMAKVFILVFVASLSALVQALEALPARLTETAGTVLIQRGQVYVVQEGATNLKADDSVVALEESNATVEQGDCIIELTEGSVYSVQEFPNCDAARQSVVAVAAAFFPEEKRAPGSFEVDPEAAERALERTLVQSGALMLQPGRMEMSTGYSFARREDEVPFLADVGDDLVLSAEDVSRNESTFRLGLRFGLPWESQLEIDLPYNYVDESRVSNLGAAGRLTESGSGSGLGDTRLGIAKTLLRERGWQPDIIFRLNYDLDTGKSDDGGVFLSDEFQELGGSFTFLKRQDPLAFVFNLNYSKSFEEKDIEPGDKYGFSVGTVLAASPKTSLQLAFANTFLAETKINGQHIDGSGGAQGILSLGATSVLSRNTVIIVSVGIGLNDAAPDYVFSVTLPIKFQIF